jgi:hypothetical protein
MLNKHDEGRISSVRYIKAGAIPVVERSMVSVCGHSPAETVGSNPAGGIVVCLLSVACCQVKVSATSLSLVQRSPTDCGASLCVI